MAERERRMTRPFGGVFVAKSQVMDAEDIRRAVRRMAHEILERNHGTEDLVIVGLQTGGVQIAHALAASIEDIEEFGEGEPGIPIGTLDVALYRDDIGIRPVLPEEVTDIPVDLDSKAVVLVDDVLYTGRTIRAALDALIDFGRPRMVQLAVMVDRGHRELPIRPDFVGKNLPTRRDELVDVTMSGVELGELQKP
ncbi:MAG: bifunctional pyr operon transcriptional regulator/uracil phosphoribosyltransferase PyrR [Microthrixaceae bacterium]